MNTTHYRTAQLHSLLLAGALATLTLVTAEVQAAGPPSVTALPAANITATTATIYGRFTANGAVTEGHLELSVSGAAFQDVQQYDIAENIVDLPVTIQLTSLNPNVRYSYRFRVSNAYGNSTSAILQFTTLVMPPAVSTLDATQITATSALLQAHVRANGLATACVFQWGVSTNDAELTNISAGQFFNGDFDGLVTLNPSFLPNSAYYYRAVVNNGLDATFGNFVYFHTAGPPAVDTLAAQNLGLSSATLRGTIAPRSLATQYYFQYGTSVNYGATVGSSSTAAAAGTNSISFNLTGLTPNQAYHYRLVASNSMGRTYGPNSTFTTITAPPTIVTETPTNVSATAAIIRGRVVTGVEEASVWFEFGSTTSYGTRGVPQPVPPNVEGTLTASVNVQRAQTYHYRLVGSNSFGLVYGNDVAFTTPAVNDHCAEAFVFNAAGFTHTQSTAGMTTGGDVLPSNPCPIGGNDVWFKTTAPESGILSVDTAGSSYDTVLGIYYGTCGSLSPIACNDDVVGGIRWSSNRVAVAAGQSYYFVVSGFLAATGTLNFRVSFIPYSRPIGSGVAISNLGPRTVTLHADVDPGFLTTTSWWLFGTNGFALDTLPAVLNSSGQPYSVDTPIKGLLPNTTYHYMFVATNSYGRFERIQSFTTPADRSLVEATVPGDLIAASSTNSPVAETAPRVIDNDVTTKYLNFDKLNAGFTVTPSGNKPVRALSLISANDQPARDPSSVIVEGSDDGVNFIRIASNAVPAFATRHGIQSIPLPGTNEFNVYRVSFPTVSNATAANSMQIAEAELLHYPEITSPNDALSMTILGPGVPVQGVQSLFDRQLDDIHKLEVFFVTGTGATRVDITPAAGPTVLKGFELIGAADDLTYPQRRPSSVVVYGSNDGVNYAPVAGGSPSAPTSNLQIQEFSSETNQVAFRYYTVIFHPPVDGGDRMQVGEMRLFGETVVVPPTLSIRANGNSVQVSWQNTPGFILETKSALGNGSWTPVGVAPVLSNGVNTVTLPKQEIGFFRLRK